MLAQGEVQNEVALGLAGVDADVAKLQCLEEHFVGELAALCHPEYLLQVLILQCVAVEMEVLLGTGAFLVQLLGDHVPHLVNQLGQEAQAVIDLAQGRLVEVVLGSDVQVDFQRMATQFMLGGDEVIPAVVELDLSKVLARYLVHSFNIDPNCGAFQRSGLIHCRAHPGQGLSQQINK